MVAIIGAGMAGLLAGAMFRGEAHVYEAASRLPNNHHALLRFRSDEIAHHLSIPFQEVDVCKIVKPFRNKVAEAIGYSMKSNGRASLRSIRSAEGKVEKRFIAPHDFIQTLEGLQSNPVHYGAPITLDFIKTNGKDPIISTIPMGSLMEVLQYPNPSSFGYRHGWVVKADLALPSDLCATIYYPEPSVPIIRATLTGDLLQIELVQDFDRAVWAVDRIMVEVLQDFGLEGCNYSAEMVPQRYAKISPIPDRERKKFIMWATDEFGVYSLGRFAVWKPGLLLDDVFHDCQNIMSMIRDGHNYHGRLPKASQ
jgi:hypothetical protein